MLFDFISAAPPDVKESPVVKWSPAATPKFKRDDRYIIMGVNFGILVADFDDAIRFQIRRPARRQRVVE